MSHKVSLRPLESTTGRGEGLSALSPASSSSTSPKVSVRQTLCVDALSSGYVLTFLDLFTLCHREPVLVDSSAETFFTVPDDVVPRLRDLLQTAEQTSREGSFEKSCESLIEIGRYFETQKDFQSCLHFYERALEVSRHSTDPQVETAALEKIGAAYDRLGLTEKAMNFYERHLKVSVSSRLGEAEKRARESLVASYAKFAADCLSEKRPAQAVAYLTKAVDAAEVSGVASMQVDMLNRLADVFISSGDFDAARETAGKCLTKCRERAAEVPLSLRKGAFMTMARIADHGGDLKAAAAFLEELLRVDMTDEALLDLDDVMQALGVLLCRMGEFTRASELFAKNFAFAQKIGDKKRTDKARILLGLARGNTGFPAFMFAVNNDRESLLAWKDRRVPLAAPSAKKSDE